MLDSSPIGSGGFADVFRAQDQTKKEGDRNAVVAIKVLREIGNEHVRRRFLREFRILQTCEHPHVMSILDSGEGPDSSLWYSMPLAKASLSDDIERMMGNEDRIVRVVRQLFDGLEYLHDLGIYHRDLKPGNILRTGLDTWAVADFGLAREEERRSTVLTSTFVGVGSYFYAAPEAWTDGKNANALADLYSLGKIIQHLISGIIPAGSYSGTSRFRSVILKATREKPEARYQTVAEMRQAFEDSAKAPDSWMPRAEEVSHLGELLASSTVDDAVLKEVLWLVAIRDSDYLEMLKVDVPRMHSSSIDRLFKLDPDGEALFEKFCEVAQHSDFDFDFCDTVADFVERVLTGRPSPQLFYAGIKALILIGHSHNRWYVRDIAVGILQGVRRSDIALAVAEALRESGPSAVEWTVGDFAIRSLHPVLRDAAESTIAKRAP